MLQVGFYGTVPVPVGDIYENDKYPSISLALDFVVSSFFAVYRFGSWRSYSAPSSTTVYNSCITVLFPS